MSAFFAATVTVPVWLVILLGVLWGVHDWSTGYRDKLAMKLYDLYRGKSDA